MNLRKHQLSSVYREATTKAVNIGTKIQLTYSQEVLNGPNRNQTGHDKFTGFSSKDPVESLSNRMASGRSKHIGSKRPSISPAAKGLETAKATKSGYELHV